MHRAGTQSKSATGPKRKPRPPRPRTVDPVLLPIQWTKTGRTKEGELIRRIRRMLIEHVGGQPSRAEALLISRTAWLMAHLAHMDERAMRDGGLSPHATREYLAWHGCVARALDTLGLKGAPKRDSGLDDPWDFSADDGL
jgi:hypothetical protein